MYRASRGAKCRIARPRPSVGIVTPPSPDAFDPERAGVDDDRALRAADAQNFERKARNNRSVMAHGESDAPHDAVVVRLRRDGAGSLCRRAELRQAAEQRFVILQKGRRIAAGLTDRRGMQRRRGRRSCPRGRAPARAPSEPRASRRPGRCSLGGSCASPSARGAGRSGSSRAISGGDSRSGSAKTMSMPRTRGCPSAMRRTSSATRVRGHGHCPYRARLFSSMSTIATRAGSLERGQSRSSRSKTRSRGSATMPKSRARSIKSGRDDAESDRAARGSATEERPHRMAG